jgi:hypothetical protein
MQAWCGVLLIVSVGCVDVSSAPEIDSANPPSDRSQSSASLRQSIALELALAAKTPGTLEPILATLAETGRIALPGFAAPTDLDALPEAWLFQPEARHQGVLFAWAPPGDEMSWSEVSAYAIGGAPVTLSAAEPPEAAVIVIESHGRLALQRDLARINRAFDRAGLKRAPAARNAVAERWTSKLDDITLADDMEPWISGDAEVYAIVSSVVGNGANLRAVELPYLTTDEKTYTPGQIVLDWNDYDYTVANIQLFEHDDDTNYQELVVALVEAVGAVGTLAGYPEVQAVTEIANRIIQAMPAGWFSNDDDYIDSFYTVEKARAYAAHPGAAQNAKITLSPYLLQPN